MILCTFQDQAINIILGTLIFKIGDMGEVVKLTKRNVMSAPAPGTDLWNLEYKRTVPPTHPLKTNIYIIFSSDVDNNTVLISCPNAIVSIAQCTCLC